MFVWHREALALVPWYHPDFARGGILGPRHPLVHLVSRMSAPCRHDKKFTKSAEVQEMHYGVGVDRGFGLRCLPVCCFNVEFCVLCCSCSVVVSYNFMQVVAIPCLCMYVCMFPISVWPSRVLPFLKWRWCVLTLRHALPSLVQQQCTR